MLPQVVEVFLGGDFTFDACDAALLRSVALRSGSFRGHLLRRRRWCLLDAFDGSVVVCSVESSDCEAVDSLIYHICGVSGLWSA